MGAYDNPQTAVDTQSANIWAQTIANIGKQTANVISKISERQSSEIKAAEKQRLADDKARAKYKQEIIARVEQFGGKSDSWYNMAYNDIDQKFNFQADLKAAKTAEQREAASKGVALYDQRIRTSVGGIKALDEFREIFAEDADLKHGVAGGSFTGDRNSKDPWSKGIGENNFLKNALIGRAVGENGEILPPVEFYQTDDGIIMGKLKGHADFNVIETINEPTVEIEDLDNGPDGISALWKKSGFTNNQGVIKPEYLGEGNMVSTTGKDGLITQTTTRQYKPEVLQALATQINTKAYGISDSVSTRDGYNDVNATFLEYGGRGNLDKNADFTLTDKGKEDFAKVILQHAGPSLIGTGELVESEVVEGRLTFDESKSNKKEIRREQADFRKENKEKETGVTYSNMMKIVNAKPKTQVEEIESILDPELQSISYNDDDQMVEIITQEEYEEKDSDGNVQKSFKPKSKFYYLGNGKAPKMDFLNSTIGNKAQWKRKVLSLFNSGNTERARDINTRYTNENINSKTKPILSGTPKKSKN
jgi:hypothetical protein